MKTFLAWLAVIGIGNPVCELHLDPTYQNLKSLYEQKQNHPLWTLWDQARANLPHLRELGQENAYFRKIADAAQAAITKHHLEFAREPHWDELDLARHVAILRSIAEFDRSRAKFSAYKIKRAIEGRHSINEYIDCKSH